MARSLVIVESPAKAKTIMKFLGRGYVVKASMGHIRDLPKTKLGVDIEHGFKPHYQTIRGRTKMLTALKEEAEKADHVYLAPDLDREGEAIAWHLAVALKVPDEKVHRVTFNEITREAVLAAFSHPGRISIDRVNAQQARRILDRIVGYKLSPLLWAKVTKGLSAGRVQSVAVRLIVEREREIEVFKPQEYWEIDATLVPADRPDERFTAQLKKVEGRDPKLDNEAAAKNLLARIEGKPWSVAAVEFKHTKEGAAPPFITSTMAQQASSNLRFSTRKTMQIAQQLYEGIELGPDGSVGLITYMRTDSVRVAEGAIAEVRERIKATFGEQYLSSKPNLYKSNKSAQGAHEAIRPTSAARDPESIRRHLTKDQHALYELIWKRFMASQMAPARYKVGNADVVVDDCTFKASGRELIFDGHTVIAGPKSREEQQVLPTLTAGEAVRPIEVVPSQHFTKPPARYSEASLISTLEKNGIGRPSTYAPIISTITERGYVELRQRRFYATELGRLVTDLLVKSFPDILDTEFTSQMESKLDNVEEARADWVEVLSDFWKLFEADLAKAGETMTSVKEQSEPTGRTCELCNKPMVYRWSRRGRFMGCSGFPECKNIKPLDENGEAINIAESDQACRLCGRPMVVRKGRNGAFLGCSGFPQCKSTKPLNGEGRPQEEKEDNGTCDKCGAAMIVRYSRRGPFLACSAYPNCKNAKPLPKEGRPKPQPAGENCPKCGSPMVIRTVRRGSFMACSAYPKCKTTKPISKPEE